MQKCSDWTWEQCIKALGFCEHTKGTRCVRSTSTKQKKGLLVVFRAALNWYLVPQHDPDGWPWCSKWKAVFWRTLFPCGALWTGGWRELSMYVGQGLFLFSLFFLLEETELEFKNSRKHVVFVYKNSVSLPDAKWKRQQVRWINESFSPTLEGHRRWKKSSNSGEEKY